MVPAVQRGMAAMDNAPVRLSELEARIAHFSAQWLRWMHPDQDRGGEG